MSSIVMPRSKGGDWASEMIYQVVRGERPCSDLFQLGVKIEIIDDKWQIEAPHLAAVKLSISDVAQGLVKYNGLPSDLKKWARLVLAAPFIDLGECEPQTGWEVLLNALWDAMGTGRISDRALHLAEELAK